MRLMIANGHCVNLHATRLTSGLQWMQDDNQLRHMDARLERPRDFKVRILRKFFTTPETGSKSLQFLQQWCSLGSLSPLP